MAKTWFITGAGRGLGVEIAKAVIRAGDRAVATGRSRKAIADVLGPDNEQLLSVKLDVANAYQARRAVDVAVAKFGAIDVLAVPRRDNRGQRCAAEARRDPYGIRRVAAALNGHGRRIQFAERRWSAGPTPIGRFVAVPIHRELRSNDLTSLCTDVV
jgi:hypothetical protein